MPLAPHFAAERRRLVQPDASHYFRPSVPGQNVEADGYHSFFDRVELGVQIEKFVLAIMMKFYAGQPGFAQHDTGTMMRLMAYRVDPELIVPVGGTGRSDSPIRIIVPAFLMQTVERSGPNGENRWCIAKRQDNYQQPFPTPALLRDDSGQYTIGGTQFCMGNLSASTPKRPCVAKEAAFLPVQPLHLEPLVNAEWCLADVYPKKVSQAAPLQTRWEFDFSCRHDITKPGPRVDWFYLQVSFDAGLGRLQETMSRSMMRELGTLNREYWPEARGEGSSRRW